MLDLTTGTDLWGQITATIGQNWFANILSLAAFVVAAGSALQRTIEKHRSISVRNAEAWLLPLLGVKDYWQYGLVLNVENMSSEQVTVYSFDILREDESKRFFRPGKKAEVLMRAYTGSYRHESIDSLYRYAPLVLQKEIDECLTLPALLPAHVPQKIVLPLGALERHQVVERHEASLKTPAAGNPYSRNQENAAIPWQKKFGKVFRVHPAPSGQYYLKVRFQLSSGSRMMRIVVTPMQ